MKADLAAESADLNAKQGIYKRWRIHALIIGSALIASPLGMLAGLSLMEWLYKPSSSIEAPKASGLPRAHSGSGRVAACNGDEFFCASLASSSLKDTVQALSANLPAVGRYRVTLKVEQVVDDYELFTPPLRAPVLD